jgi:hypothetical protein
MGIHVFCYQAIGHFVVQLIEVTMPEALMRGYFEARGRVECQLNMIF